MNLVVKDWHIELKNKNFKAKLKENEDVEGILKTVGYWKNLIADFKELNNKSTNEYINIVSSIYDINMDIKSIAEAILGSDTLKSYCLRAGVRRGVINTEASNLAHIGLKNYVEVETVDIIAYAKIPKKEFTRLELEQEIKNKNIILTFSKPYYLPIKSDIWYLNLENKEEDNFEDLCFIPNNFEVNAIYNEMLKEAFASILTSKRIDKDIKKLQKMFLREVEKARKVILMQMNKEMENFSLYKKERQEELKLEEKSMLAYKENVLQVLDSN